MAKWKKSEDITQDLIRSSKAEWSADTSEFIDNFLNLKKFINGKSNKFYSGTIPLHKIKDVESNIITLLSNILSEWNELYSKINSIIDSQYSYSTERKQKKVVAQVTNPYTSIIELKKTWNSNSREFLKNIIQFKRLINGLPSSYFEDKSKIIEPIPSDPKAILNELHSQLGDLLSSAEEILKSQVEASSKKKPSTADIYTRIDKFVSIGS